jgi:hypothetical protein
VVWLIAIGLGNALFFWWMGYGRTLDPRDLGWINHDDPFTHFIGWEYYRSAPLAQYPITQNALYGSVRSVRSTGGGTSTSWRGRSR